MMQETKLIVTGDYLDAETGLRFVEDIRGNLHFCPMMDSNTDADVEIPPITLPSTPSVIDNIIYSCSCSPEIIVTIDLAYEKDKEIYSLLSENAWLWKIIEQAIKDKKEKNCSYAMTKLEQAVNGGMP